MIDIFVQSELAADKRRTSGSFDASDERAVRRQKASRILANLAE